jgi:hypothetical protein
MAQGFSLNVQLAPAGLNYNSTTTSLGCRLYNVLKRLRVFDNHAPETNKDWFFSVLKPRD